MTTTVEFTDTQRDSSGGRLETGVVSPADDWPGVFIRGDNALHFAFVLRNNLDRIESVLDQMTLKGLADTLGSCSVGLANKED